MELFKNFFIIVCTFSHENFNTALSPDHIIALHFLLHCFTTLLFNTCITLSFIYNAAEMIQYGQNNADLAPSL